MHIAAAWYALRPVFDGCFRMQTCHKALHLGSSMEYMPDGIHKCWSLHTASSIVAPRQAGALSPLPDATVLHVRSSREHLPDTV